MAAEIEERFDISPELIQGDKGVFDVRVEGDLVFSKHLAGRFPKPGEVPGIIAARGNAQPGA